MFDDKSIVERPSFIEVKLAEDGMILYDYLFEQRFVLSPIAYEIFLEFDGIKSIKDIAIIIAQKYDQTVENINQDVVDLAKNLARLNIVLVKGTLKYKFTEIYYKMIFYKSTDNTVYLV